MNTVLKKYFMNPFDLVLGWFRVSLEYTYQFSCRSHQPVLKKAANDE